MNPKTTLAPVSAADIANQIAGYTAKLPRPESDAQIRAKAQGLLDPVVKSITDRATAQTKAAAGATAGYASRLADSLGSYDASAHDIYSGAEKTQAQSNDVQQAALRGGGAQLAQALTAQMEGFGAGPDAINTHAAPQAATGAGAANALLGTGSAALDQLIGNETAARDYGAKLPGLARTQGAADIRDITLAGNKTLADNVAGVESKLPDVLQSLYTANDTKKSNVATAGEQLREYLTGRNDSINKFLKAEEDAGLVATTKADASVKAAQIKADAQAGKDSKPNATLSGKVGYLADSNGHWIAGPDGKPQVLPGFKMQNGQVVKTKTGAGGKSGVKTPTADQITTLIKQWHDGTTTKGQEKLPNPDSNGNPVYRATTMKSGQVSFSTAYKRLKTILTNGGMDAATADGQARTYLQGYYKRGETDRGWLTNEEQATLAAAKVAPRAYTNSGVGYLRPDQAKALKAAGKLPPGHWIQGSTDTQDLGPVYVIEP